MQLSYEQNNLLIMTSKAITKQSLTGLSCGAIPNFQEAIDQAVLPLVCSVIPQNMYEDSEQMMRYNNWMIASNIKNSFEHTELHNILSENNIPYVILKGVASASYYPEPILRTMGDVDFLINVSDLQRTGILLESIGFIPKEDKGGIHIAYYRDRSIWEMHRSINGIPDSEIGNTIRAYLSDIIETAVDYNEGNGIVRIPDHFHHGLVLLLHTASHLTSEGVGLRHLCDWAVFVNHFSSDEFVTLFEEKLKACGLWRFAQILTLVSIKYLQIPEKEWAGEADDELLENLICDIMNGGNFGHKDADRYRQIKYISNRGEHTVDRKPTILQLWNTIGKKAEAEGKTHFGIIADYVKLVMEGKRKLDSKETIQQAQERKCLYAEFHLFE